MSDYIKRVVILRALMGGEDLVLRCESGSAVSVGVSPKPDGSLHIYDGKKLFSFSSLPASVSELDISGPLSAGITHTDSLTHFGSAGVGAPSRRELTDKIKKELEARSAADYGRVREELYDDEQLADENYYETHMAAERNDGEKQTYNNAETESRAQGKTAAGAGGYNSRLYDETAYSRAGENDSAGGGDDFYSTVRDETQKLFSRGTAVPDLGEVVPHSKWVKVNYSSDRHYVVGLVSDGDNVKYICYGVPGRFGNPPEKLKNLASFVPESLFNLHGDGYYVMFQSGKTGERLTPKIDLFGL